MNRLKRRICFVITSENHYTRSRMLINECRSRPDLDVKIVVGASAILSKYSNVLSLMKQDRVSPAALITMMVEGGSPAAMAKTTGLGLLDLVTVFGNLNPDVIVVRGDRYEVLAATIAAAYLNITVAHIEGGDVSGTIDESVRHAITKLSHIHLTTNKLSKERVIRMGEDPKYVFNVGDPAVEFVVQNRFSITDRDINYPGVGDNIDITKPFLIVFLHPVTTEIGENRKNATILLKAIRDFDIQVLWFWPNVDAGSEEIAQEIRRAREHKKTEHIRFIKYLPPEQFCALLYKTKCLIGNSSSGIKESSYCGTPVVNIGSRQGGRLRAKNVIDVGYDIQDIRDSIQKQINRGRYPRSTIYYKKGANKRIADILSSVPLYSQKRFHDQ